MQKWLIANWKENPKTESAALKLFLEVAKVKRSKSNVVICPPFVYLEEISSAFMKMKTPAKKNLSLGVQDVFWEESGAFTSEVGPKMVKSLGARFVILGHSERRKYLKETDEMINRKVRLAIKDGLQVVLCVGESLAVRKQGIASAEKFVKDQLKKDLAGVKKPVIVAYEPIWAIGSGKNDSPEDAGKMAKFIKKTVKAKVLYGGSVNHKNIKDFLNVKEIDGALVGGASLKAGEFGKMIS